MSIEQFAEALARLGIDLNSWPAVSAAEAQALLNRSAEARRLLEREQELDRLMRSPASARAPRGMVDRIVARATGKPPKDPTSE